MTTLHKQYRKGEIRRRRPIHIGARLPHSQGECLQFCPSGRLTVGLINDFSCGTCIWKANRCVCCVSLSLCFVVSCCVYLRTDRCVSLLVRACIDGGIASFSYERFEFTIICARSCAISTKTTAFLTSICVFCVLFAFVGLLCRS